MTIMKTRKLKRALLVTLISLALAPSSSAFADTGDFGIAVKAGTLGIGGEVAIGILPSLNARASYNGFNYDGTTTESDIKYDYKLKLKSVPVLLDWHPFENSGFRLSSGAVFNNNDVKATGTSQSLYTIGGATYTGAEIGTLTGAVTFKKVAPYAGIGWGNAVGKESGLSIAFDLGVMFQGQPDVSLSASGPIASIPSFQTNLDAEINDVKNKIENVKYYPVVSLGLAYRL
jgi:hypothetical protein